MSELSKQYHSINIGDVNTWDDWHIVPTSRPLVATPSVRESYVEIPGADGVLDYTEALAGKPVYGQRTGSWEFIVINGYQDWTILYNIIRDYLHGKKFEIILDDEPDYVYTGRLKLNEWRSEEHWSVVVIEYNIDPYRRRKSVSVEDWLWDDLTFDSTAYLIYYGRFNVVDKTIRNIYNPSSVSQPLYVSLTSDMNVYWYGTSVDLTAGIEINTGISLGTGDNLITFTGNGTVTILYEKGASI